MRRAVFNMRDERPVWAPPAWVPPRLRTALGDDWELVVVEANVSGRGDGGGTSLAALEAIRGAEIYFGLGLPRPLLQAALEPPARLRWVHTGTAGVASLLHPELTAHDIALTNSAGIHAEPIADTVIAMMLHFMRGIDCMVRAQQRSTWDAAPFERRDSGIREVEGATIGVIGYGGIGRAVARRARALGMRVHAVRRSPREDDPPEVLRGDDALERALRDSDVVAVCTPSTPETRRLIGERELGWLRPECILINIARGDVIDEHALLAALHAGRVRAAALDVFIEEPLPHTAPLWQLDNVLVSPHVSATSPRFWERQSELILDNIARYLRGAPLRNRVDPSAGY